ncbi:P-loop containing nucleoside triphosphate hydrolase protein [Polychytrium aggregatum]|uniref:P-loop containing nucleoside triphosphate hydrolase protein n=1 Tax=Polychytrium aggregatum TaxID=110093 RepID=UPI0022FDD10A|nr:P-loop containing nucleoside triphosphate hydrolase protein [Polychytrium aggregatum]KAI9205440.1 P-loop containing nucleoside triphosphate hydrolase protein [Polychytrium aggregatum]
MAAPHLQPITAFDALERVRSEYLLRCSVAAVDRLVGGGLTMGKMTEICGGPAIGKTTLAMQYAVNVQLPARLGGMDGQAIFVDTEGGFNVERFQGIAERTLAKPVSSGDDVELPTVEAVLEGLHCFRIFDHYQLLALCHQLSRYLQQHRSIKLVVIDSIAALFRHMSDPSRRLSILNLVSNILFKIADKFGLVIVTTSHLTLRSHALGSESTLLPAMGEKASTKQARTNDLILLTIPSHSTLLERMASGT